MQHVNNKSNENEVLIFMDDTSWIWDFTRRALQPGTVKSIKVPSNTLIRQSWSRLSKAGCIVIHWEGKHRSGGAILEEILEITPEFDTSDRVVVITTNPVHEDVVYFAELGIKRVVRPRLREKDIHQATKEIQQHLNDIFLKNRTFGKDSVWAKLAAAIDNSPKQPQPGFVEKIAATIKKLRDPSNPPSLAETEAVVSFQIKTGNLHSAEETLKNTLEAHPNYFRGWNRLADIKRQAGDHQGAYALLQKMHMQNRGSVRRLVAMGEVQLALKNPEKAEPYFRSALDQDAWCAKALNGLAEVTFAKDDLEETRLLLSRSSLAYRFAVQLNTHGIELAKDGRYAEALEHYSKAQYVLPQQEKSPRLFYNIALCYAKWGRPELAKEFLELALIKEPNYKKAQKTLEALKQSPQKLSKDDLDAA